MKLEKREKEELNYRILILIETYADPKHCCLLHLCSIGCTKALPMVNVCVPRYEAGQPAGPGVVPVVGV
jgi:hypothetical protein